MLSWATAVIVWQLLVTSAVVAAHAMKTRPRPPSSQGERALTEEQMEVVLGQAEDDADMQVRAARGYMPDRALAVYVK